MTPSHNSLFVHEGKKQKIFLAGILACSVFLIFFLVETRISIAQTNDVSNTATISTTEIIAPPIDTEAEALREKITQKNTELDVLKKQINTYEKQLIYTQDQAKTLQNTVKSLDIDRQKMSASIQLTQKKLETSTMTLTQLNFGIVETEEKTSLVNKALAEILRTIDQDDTKTFVEMFLSNGKLSDILDESMQLMQLREQAREHAKELSMYRESLVTQKTKVEGEKKKLTNYKVALSDQKSVLDNAKKEKAALLVITKNRESDYQKILNANKAKRDALEQELSDYESKLTRQITAPKAGSKILAWPLENPFITQLFGVTKDSVRLYASGSHNGIDLRASRGTPLTSPAKGEVVGTGDTDIACPKASYGKWVLIRHDNGLTTLMAHFDVIKVSTGQSVETGDLIGYSGNTGYSTGPHLHFSVFASDGVVVGNFPSKSCSGRTFTMPLPTAKNAYLNPSAYLPEI
jgi:murein DD-endopeptidase MepM/ murein hydrolase activator NlpD